ncbi:hypothetical protein niasHS_017804 [Heterodera schachtii]|uniref:Uncharacterized protein n=1 Tax=Heterodera schachtii TaxID=97005 RepID=A0ABD2I4Q4_HETSC
MNSFSVAFALCRFSALSLLLLSDHCFGMVQLSPSASAAAAGGGQSSPRGPPPAAPKQSQKGEKQQQNDVGSSSPPASPDRKSASLHSPNARFLRSPYGVGTPRAFTGAVGGQQQQHFSNSANAGSFPGTGGFGIAGYKGGGQFAAGGSGGFPRGGSAANGGAAFDYRQPFGRAIGGQTNRGRK